MIVMGRTRAPFGVRGWVKVEPFTETVDSLLAYPEWWLAGAEGWEPHEVTEGAQHGAHLVVRFAGCVDREAAGRLKHRDVAIPRSRLPDAPGKYYWSDLLDLEVFNARGERMGRVDRLIETGANAVLAVKGDDTELLLPFVEGVIVDIRPDAGRIVVDWERDY
jgi:16S rRNA processing protein RimM